MSLVCCELFSYSRSLLIEISRTGGPIILLTPGEDNAEGECMNALPFGPIL